MSLIETASWLVDIPSETGNEGRICTQIAERLLPTLGERRVRRVNNSLVIGERTGRPLVLLVGHIDTVPSQGQGPARIEGDRLHGLGAADMKSGVAVILHLLEDRATTSGPYDVVGVLYEGEEGPAEGNGLEPVLTRVPWLSEAEFALVLEPSDGQIQVGCNGAMNARVVFTGVSAHSARPWWGTNAISKAGDWLAVMHRREPELHLVEGLEFREVFSVTQAEGGIANNIIPDRFTLNLNYRFPPILTLDEARARLMEVCGEADAVEIVDEAPAGPVGVDHPLLEALAEAAGAVRAPKQGWTDVARLGLHGIPAVNFGPGEAAQAHQANESVALDSVHRHFDAIRQVLGAVSVS